MTRSPTVGAGWALAVSIFGPSLRRLRIGRPAAHGVVLHRCRCGPTLEGCPVQPSIVRYVFFHSVALAALVGLMVLAQAYIFPITELVVR
jgi:hypothetical protein